jgi:hypothetical protein
VLHVDKALQIKERLLSQNKKEYDTFRASPGWFKRLRRRNGITNLHWLRGEAGSVNEHKALALMLKFKNLVEATGISEDRIYNADETGLYYNKLPNTMYLSEIDRCSARGTKEMHSKDRVTVMLCCNSSGTHKVPLFVIGKSARPHCFATSNEDIRKQVPYTSQKNAWMDAVTCTRWFESVFLPAVKARHGSQRVLLYWDNAPSHLRSMAKNTTVKIIMLPENLTSRHQPMDMGIIAAFKKCYKTKLLRAYEEVMSSLEMFQKALADGKEAPAGSRGIKYGMKATIMDAMKICLDVWTATKPDGIINCFIVSNSLPTNLQARLQETTKHDLTVAAAAELKLQNAANKELVNALKGLMHRAKQAGQEIASLTSAFNDICIIPDDLDIKQLEDAMTRFALFEDHPRSLELQLEETEVEFESGDNIGEQGTMQAENATIATVPLELTQQHDTDPPTLAEAEASLNVVLRYMKSRNARSEDMTHIDDIQKFLTQSYRDARKVQTSITGFFHSVRRSLPSTEL